jgi:hypothetical protein
MGGSDFGQTGVQQAAQLEAEHLLGAKLAEKLSA